MFNVMCFKFVLALLFLAAMSDPRFPTPVDMFARQFGVKTSCHQEIMSGLRGCSETTRIPKGSR